MRDGAARGDDGMTLVELILYSALTLLVVGGLAGVLVNTWTAQANATTVGQATTRGTVFAEGIEKAMRNAYAFRVTGSGSTLSVWTGLGGAAVCQGYTVDGSGALRMTATAGSAVLPAASTWPVWQTGAAQIGSTAYFTATSTAVSYSFRVTTAGAPVAFTGTETVRTSTVPASAGVNPCW